MSGAARRAAVLAELGLTRWHRRPPPVRRRRCRIEWPPATAATPWAADLLRVLTQLGWEAEKQTGGPAGPLLRFCDRESEVRLSGDELSAPEPARLAADPDLAAALWRALLQWS